MIEAMLCESIGSEFVLPIGAVAQIAKCSKSTVKKVRKGIRGKSGNGKAGTVQFIDKYLADHIWTGVLSVKEIINSQDEQEN